MKRHFNTAPPKLLWVDLNSAFATAEQQAHPSLRNRPVGITNRISPECCIITASKEAKAAGVRTGTRRSQALRLCPDLIILESDSAKYNFVYNQLFNIMQDYSPDCAMKSIDEGYINLASTNYQTIAKLTELAQTIKQRVKDEIGEYVTINIGIGNSHFWAKLAAGLHKPDGLDIITASNVIDVYSQLQLEDLTGIAQQFGRRLRQAGLTTPLEFVAASEQYLRKVVFHGVNGTYWYNRLRGYEVDDYRTKLSTIGRQWVVDHGGDNQAHLSACLHSLVESVGLKLRFRRQQARGVSLWLDMQSGSRYYRKYLANYPLTSDQSIWAIAKQLFDQRPTGRVRCIGVSVYNSQPDRQEQASLLIDQNRSTRLTSAIDKINHHYGVATIHSAHSTIGNARVK